MYNLPWQLLLQLYEVLPQNPKSQSKNKLVLKYSQISFITWLIDKVNEDLYLKLTDLTCPSFNGYRDITKTSTCETPTFSCERLQSINKHLKSLTI